MAPAITIFSGRQLCCFFSTALFLWPDFTANAGKLCPPPSQKCCRGRGHYCSGRIYHSGIISADRDAPQLRLNDLSPRCLHKKYPYKPIYFTGFSGKLRPKGWSEDEHRTYFLIYKCLIDFHFERQSRNTAQNAQFTYQMIQPERSEMDFDYLCQPYDARGSQFKNGWPPMILLPVDYKHPNKGRASLLAQHGVWHDANRLS